MSVQIRTLGGSTATIPADRLEELRMMFRGLLAGPQDEGYEEARASVDGNWADPADADAVIAWVRDFVAEAEALSAARGTYLNFQSERGDAAEILSAAFGANLERLTALKGRYDPANLLRVNNNIAPPA